MHIGDVTSSRVGSRHNLDVHRTPTILSKCYASATCSSPSVAPPSVASALATSALALTTSILATTTSILTATTHVTRA